MGEAQQADVVVVGLGLGGEQVARRIRDEATDTWDDKVAVDRFLGKGGRFVRGRATVAGPGRVKVEEQGYAASRALVIAAGTIAPVPTRTSAIGA
jgi:pyruvate/2-oxoglutarate dehydrogenase complex dihydrolipoamide dehydrogenase (E3) component